ncbi:MAG: adenylate/guanylate cyclase domain-containing protein [Bacteroidota bacterium]
MSSQRRLAAIMFTDIAGYTAMMQENEAKAIELRQRHREVFEREHENHRGQIIQYYGDGTLSVFESAVDAAACALDMQSQFRESPQVPLRIGIHTGDILVSDTEVIGDGVNVASRVESMAIPGSVLVSETVYDNLKNQEQFPGESLGIFTFKNVSKPIEVFALSAEGLSMPNPKKLGGKFLKRQSAQPNLWQRLPKWVQYSVGVVAFLLLAPIIYAPVTQLFESQAGQGVMGQGFERASVSFGEKKGVVVANFEVAEADTNLRWAEIGVPMALTMDWEQDPYMYEVYEPFQTGDKSFKDYIDIAKEKLCDWILTGSFSQSDSGYDFTAVLHPVNQDQDDIEIALSGTELMTLLDEAAVMLKIKLGVPEGHLRQVTDLPLKQSLTESETAYIAFSEAFRQIRINPIQGFYMMKAPLDLDSTFAWASYTLASFIRAYQLSPNKQKQYIAQAMRHRSRLPDILEIKVRQLNYRVNGQPEKALELNRLFVTQVEPENPRYINSLIEESYIQGDYQTTLEGIDSYENLTGEEVTYATTKAKIFLIEGKPEEAREVIERYLKQYPNQVEANLLLAEILVSQEEWDEAADLVSKSELLFPEAEGFTRLKKHIDFHLENGLASSETLDAMTGEYRTLLKTNYVSQITHQGNTLILQVENVPPFIMYQVDDQYNFASLQDPKIQFLKDSTSDAFTGFYFQNLRFGITQEHIKVQGALKKVLDGLLNLNLDLVANNLEEAKQMSPGLAYLDLVEDHLALREAGELLKPEDLQAMVGRYALGNTVLTTKLDGDHLTLNQNDLEWAEDPVPLLQIAENTFIIVQGAQTTLTFELAGSRATAITLQLLGTDQRGRFERVSE